MYAIQGGASKELVTFQGQVIVHDNIEELNFLFPKGQAQFMEVELDGDTLRDGRPVMQLKDHPDMETVRWPLREQDFVQVRGQTRRQEAEAMLKAMRNGQGT